MNKESNPFSYVQEFEEVIAEYFGSQYAIATDSCTHAIELCLRYEGYDQVTIPEHTYISIPFICKKLNLNWKFEKNKWSNNYTLGNTNIIDAAVFWEQDSYISGTYMCLSFQFRKHLSIGRGGMILTDDIIAYETLKKMSYDGRRMDIPWSKQDIDIMGYHYYMTPESALNGLNKFYKVKDMEPKYWTYQDYPYLPKMRVFN
jgi:dTDP-4-amino-4,6-dideoxygalactose transaminase